MRIYIAHNFEARIELRKTVELLESLGHTVTSRWIKDDSIFERSMIVNSLYDISDIICSDVLIFFSDNYGDKPGKGKYVELGYALAKGKRIFIVGQNNNSCIFYSLCEHVKTFEELEKFLA